MQKFEIITFDCYGTLIDWESGIADAFHDAAPELPREAVLRTYASIEPLVETEQYRRYRDVLTESAFRVGDAFGVRIADPTFLARSLPSWKPFADTNPALERLRDAGYRLGILSNVDRDLFAGTRKHFTVDFDLIVTAEDVGSYKPASGHFLAARERIGAARWLHAAQSNYHDIVPVNAMGVPTAWVNRRAGTPLPGGVPTYEVRDMAGLADLLA
ncbi:MAG TPA: HAD-IA family hydrolase [Thermoanaerobaculia bacterium]|nr:HAD-IA family hydrolase [Thermoanaerobaculia bacterium]